MTRMAGQNLGLLVAPYMEVLASQHSTVGQQEAAAIGMAELMNRLGAGPGMDPRDYRTDDGLWRSELLPLNVSIDQAIQDGIWS
jgi:hypothetical protein